MTLISIVLALLIEQARPLAVGRVNGWLDAWSRQLEARFNAGERSHGIAAWAVGAALPALLVLVAFGLAVWSNWLLAVLLGVGILYLTMGFRQFSHHFTDIHLALRMGELERARQLLANWRGISGERLSSSEIARLAIEEALLSSHRHVFAPLFWFTLLGPAGALLYRLARHFCYAWGGRGDGELGAFGDFARRAFAVIDWLPVRLTAASFAIVGDFEDAIFCWRSQAGRWPEEAGGILLAAGAGALGVRLGMPIGGEDVLAERPELGVGEDADPDFMQSTIGLVWRTLVMALLLLTLLGIANWAS
ncbi:MAG TPA: CobD/CbiB family protein [Rhodocyclaceae bacterium]|nr:CobD/CbiB family protein [Rhodocyclaceae bacterium]